MGFFCTQEIPILQMVIFLGGSMYLEDTTGPKESLSPCQFLDKKGDTPLRVPLVSTCMSFSSGGLGNKIDGWFRGRCFAIHSKTQRLPLTPLATGGLAQPFPKEGERKALLAAHGSANPRSGEAELRAGVCHGRRGVRLGEASSNLIRLHGCVCVCVCSQAGRSMQTWFCR